MFSPGKPGTRAYHRAYGGVRCKILEKPSGTSFKEPRCPKNTVLFGALVNGRSRLNPPFGEGAADGRFVPAHALSIQFILPVKRRHLEPAKPVAR